MAYGPVNAPGASATQSGAGLMSATDKKKLDGIAEGATKAVPSTTAPKALGTASAGSESSFARGDHVHPKPSPADLGAAPTSHTHTKSQITDFPTSMTPASHASSHGSSGSDPITPANIGAAPASHTHTKSQISDFPTTMTPTAHTHKKSEISDFPTSMTPASHAVNENTYGLGTGSVYGHVKLSDSVSDTSAAASGVAATPSAVKQAYDLAQKALAAAGAAQEYTEDALKALFGGTLPDKTLENNSPEIIQRAAYLGLGANFWSVGDKIPIPLNGTVGSLTFNNETYYAFILGFNHNAGLEGGNGIDFQFGKTSTGTNIAFVDDSYDTSGSTAAFRMNTTGTNSGGWENSYMRNTICPAFLAAMPANWQKMIAPCTKYSDNKGGGTDTASNVTATVDKIFLLSEWEVFGATQIGSNSAERNYQKQYDYYKNSNSTVKYKHNDISTACNWRLRSVYSGSASHFRYASTNNGGSMNYYGSTYSYGFAPCFRLGASKGEQAA